MVGYSATPLVKKLGIKLGFRMIALFEPPHYLDLLSPLPEGVVIKESGRNEVDFIHLFVKETEGI